MTELGLGHEAFWLGMLRHLWQTVLVILPIWWLDRALNRAPARFHATLWWTALLKFLVPLSLLAPLIAPWLPKVSWSKASVTVTTAWAGLRTVLEPAVLTHDASGSGAGAGFLALSAVWLGAGTLLASVGLWRAWRRSRATMCSAPATTLDVLRAAAEQAGVPFRSVRITEQPIMPSLAGLVRSRILVPRILCDELSVQELGAILVHEDAHRRRRDPARGLIALTALSLFWFFPPVWLVLRKLRHAAELSCDEAVLRAGVAPEIYARALARTVRLGFLQPLGATAFARSNKPALTERLRRIRNPRRFRPMVRHRVIVSLAFLLLVGSMVAAGAAAGGQQSRGGALGPRSLLHEIGEDFPELVELHGADKVTSIEITDRPLRRVLERLAQLGGFEIDTAALDATQRGSLTVRNTSVGGALATLGRMHGLWYEISSDGRVLVAQPLARIGRQIEGGEIQAPQRLDYVSPEYPESARREGVEGTVVLEAVLGLAGRMERVRVLRGVHPALDEAAASATMQWRYEPVVVEGRPVKLNLVVTVTFRREPVM